MTVHNYITPEGEVRWVKDMPVKPKYGKWAHDDKANQEKYIEYQSALSKAKEESVPWEDQQKLKEIIGRLTRDGFYSFEFNGEVKVVVKSPLELKFCTSTHGEYKSVARLIPSVTETKNMDINNFCEKHAITPDTLMTIYEEYLKKIVQEVNSPSVTEQKPDFKEIAKQLHPDSTVTKAVFDGPHRMNHDNPAYTADQWRIETARINVEKALEFFWNNYVTRK